MTLVEWSAERPDWQRDALRRIAVAGELTEADRKEIARRLRHSHGISVEGDVQCTPLAAEHLPARDQSHNSVVLLGLGPLHHVDRLADDQELRFAVNGITLVYGDNGTGKSGYSTKSIATSRETKQICRSAARRALDCARLQVTGSLEPK